MAYPDDVFFAGALGIVQFAGLASAWFARLHEGSGRQRLTQYAFLGLLALMALTTMASLVLDTRYWLTSGATLGVMVLAAIWDFRSHEAHPSARHLSNEAYLA
jgi:hypothetical protein